MMGQDGSMKGERIGKAGAGAFLEGENGCRMDEVRWEVREGGSAVER